MIRFAAILVFAAVLAGCGFFGTMIDGFKHTRAVEAALEKSVGLKPQVGFKWTNGRLRLVTVTFPRLYEKTPLRELADIVRRAVVKEFEQKPDDIQLGFSLGAADAGVSAQAPAASHATLALLTR